MLIIQADEVKAVYEGQPLLTEPISISLSSVEVDKEEEKDNDTNRG